ncbi:molybdenum cofactor guanylyltransferase [Thalassotalea psychrophila]|uniref:Molybdenum cofactor guanylyltransferase n=1 Tax=Thalassotalea psychrophila TaxID=3065647 RepID=A0ABY9TS10_9GAMM|nr:molybdenum cofactor guanylyltransferase [Colwelliaceae bacterium SQ149]
MMDCLGIILAGGQSSRMGENKAFLTLKNDTMLSHCQSLLQQCHLDKIEISGSNSGGIADLVVQGGPLAGIHSLIKKYQPRSVLVLPIDMPFITAQHLQELKLKGTLANKACHYTKCSLPAYIPVNALLSQFLDDEFSSPRFLASGKGPSFKQVFKLASSLSVDQFDRQVLVNTNTPDEWQQAKKLINKNIKRKLTSRI